jgi:hypothetical protein
MMQSNAWAKDEPNDWSPEADAKREAEFKRELMEAPKPSSSAAPMPGAPGPAPQQAATASSGTPWVKYAMWGGVAVGAWWLWKNWGED